MKSLKSFAVGSALALSACSGGIGSKQDAAQALNRLMVASSVASSQSQLQASGLQKLTINGTVTVSGRSGTATVTMKASSASGEPSAALDIEFSSFSADGENTFDGTQSYSVVTALSGLSAEVKTSMNADVTMSGEYNAKKMTCDVTIAVSAARTATSGKVSMTINGTVTADGKTFAFENESFEVDVQS